MTLEVLLNADISRHFHHLQHLSDLLTVLSQSVIMRKIFKDKIDSFSDIIDDFLKFFGFINFRFEQLKMHILIGRDVYVFTFEMFVCSGPFKCFL